MLKSPFPLKKGSKKLINAWAFYDWANSVYPLVISSTIFPIYYGALFDDINTISFFDVPIKNTAVISFVIAAAFIIVALSSPILSGIADYLGNKVKFMKFYVYMGSFSCVALYWFDIDNIYFGLFFYFLALIGFWGGLVFYNSYLPEVAYPDQQDRSSARGFSFGYVGSVSLLLFNLFMIMNPKLFGIPGNENESSMIAMRYSFILVGVWWVLFSQYSFYYLPRVRIKKKVSSHVIWNGYRELRNVWRLLKNEVGLKRYLPAFFIYSTALQTVILIAAYFGEEEILWPDATEKTIGLIVSILLIQLVGIIGAYFTARASEKFGSIPILIIINISWAIICLIAYHIKSPFEFYVTACFVGLFMGGVQALSRSTYSRLIPKTNNTTSFFSFYDVSEKIGIVIGMIIFGILDQYTGNMRTSIIFFLILFLIGALMLNRVPRDKLSKKILA